MCFLVFFNLTLLCRQTCRRRSILGGGTGNNKNSVNLAALNYDTITEPVRFTLIQSSSSWIQLWWRRLCGLQSQERGQAGVNWFDWIHQENKMEHYGSTRLSFFLFLAWAVKTGWLESRNMSGNISELLPYSLAGGQWNTSGVEYHKSLPCDIQP